MSERSYKAEGEYVRVFYSPHSAVTEASPPNMNGFQLNVTLDIARRGYVQAGIKQIHNVNYVPEFWHIALANRSSQIPSPALLYNERSSTPKIHASSAPLLPCTQ